MKKRIYDALRFEGGTGSGSGTGAAAGAPSSGNAEGTAQDGGSTGESQDANGADEGAHAPAQKTEAKKSLREILQNDPDLDDQYNKLMQNNIRRRFGDYEDLKQNNAKYQSLMNLMQDAFPDAPRDGNIDAMMNYLQAKNDLWADAAASQHMDVETYKQMKQIERQNAELLGEQRAQLEAQRRQQMFASWDAQVPEVQAKYPTFNLLTEADNPRFIGLLDQGWTMMQAFEAVHATELAQLAAQTAAQQAQQSTVQAIRAGQGRPVENGAGQRTGNPSRPDPSKFTDKEMDDYIRRIKSGERISF